jgi:hypothetical protein
MLMRTNPQSVPICESGTVMFACNCLRTAMTLAPTSTVRASSTSRFRSVTGVAATRPNMAMKNTARRETALKNCIVAELERKLG